MLHSVAFRHLTFDQSIQQQSIVPCVTLTCSSRSGYILCHFVWWIDWEDDHYVVIFHMGMLFYLSKLLFSLAVPSLSGFFQFFGNTFVCRKKLLISTIIDGAVWARISDSEESSTFVTTRSIYITSKCAVFALFLLRTHHRCTNERVPR